MESQGKRPADFTSRMNERETIAALMYLPIHIAVLPAIGGILMQGGQLNAAEVNLGCYLIGAAYMLVALGAFLRREFDPLCDGILRCLLEILICYGLMMGFNLIVGSLLMLVDGLMANPNNEAIMEMADIEFGKISAMAVFLAPIVEELMFRGGIFGTLRKYNRPAAYALSMLAFSLYHVWAYAISDPTYWIYIIQYLPVSYLLCRCYERSNTIWASIFLHMLINGIAVQALSMLQELL